MKKHRIILLSFLAVAALGLFGACSKSFQEVTDLVLSRCLQPMNVSAKISQGQDVTFSWDVTKDAESYLLEVYTDKDMKTLCFKEKVSPIEVPYEKHLEVDEEYWFRVKAQCEGLEDSKWASYSGSIKTYAVKGNLYPKVTERTSASVSFKWNIDSEVDRIEYKAVGTETPATYTLTKEDIAAGTATVTGLTASTEYDFILYYSSANRGEVDAWTLPDASKLTIVETNAALLQAIKDGASALVKMSGSPYTIGEADLEKGLDVSKGFKLYGEGDAEGNRPVIYGTVSLADDFDGGDIYFEGIEFNGNASKCGFAIQKKNGGNATDLAVKSIVYKNCAITSYSKGLFYEWGKTLKIGEFTYDCCEIHEVNADGTGGGDGLDLRNATSIDKLTLTGNTIYNGFRTFLRIDAAPVIGDVVFTNNTVMNICFVDNTNNAGIVGFQVAPTSFTMKNNLFLNMPEKSTMTSSNAKYIAGDKLNLAADNNWFYNVNESFFTTNFTLAMASGKTLSADPCYNAKGGRFNILADSEIAGKKVGAPKWWSAYVEEPEDLTLDVLEGSHTWDFTNAKFFSGDVTKAKVRDQLLMYVKSNKITLSDEGVFGFTTAATTTKKGVPTDGYFAFKVNTSGSVVIRPEDETNSGYHLAIGIGPETGSSISIKGGAAALSDMTGTQKITILGVNEECLVYIYPTGAISLRSLAWSTDTSAVNTALPAPKPTAAPATITAGEAKDVVISWEPVENAGSYSVVFSGKTYEVSEGTSYTIASSVIGMLDAGVYTASVYANPAKSDIYNTMSAAGTAAFAIQPKGGDTPGGEFIVSSVEELQNAISAGKDAITLKYSDTPYAIGAMTLTAPLHLKGQSEGGKKTPVTASFTLSGEIGGSVVFTGLEFVGDGTSVIIDDKTTAAPVADTVAIYDSYLHGTKALYDNSGKALSNIQNVIFEGNLIKDCSDGADFIDLRTGAHHNFVFCGNTVANSCRTFIRTDEAHEMNSALIRNNTFYKVATNSTSKDNNGIFHIRSAAGSGLNSYKIQNNFFYSILIDAEPGNANGYPKFISKNAAALKPNAIMNNYFYNIEERDEKSAYSWWTVNCSREEGLAGGGAIVAADPCKDAATGDFTLTNAVMMNAGVGDPRWNPMAGSNPTSEITVKNAEEFLTAVSAGKTTITLAAGDYDLTAAVAEGVSNGKLTLTTALNVIGESGAHFMGGFVFNEGVTSFSIKGVKLDGASTVDNVFEVAQAAVSMTSMSIKDCEITAYKNRLFYMGQEANLTSLEVSGNVITGITGGDFTSGDFIDIRKGTVSAMKVRNNTIANAVRTFARVDAAVVMNSALIANNTFYNMCYVDSKDNNGILHFRSSTLLSANTLTVKSNIFASMHRAADPPSQANGFPKLVSNSSEKLGHPAFASNYFYDIDTTASYSWWNTIGKEEPLAGNGVVLGTNPFKDAAGGDFTLVNALAASENIGDPRWNKTKGGSKEEGFAVANVDELLTAVSAGKTVLKLAAGTYDLTAVTENPDISSGVWTVKNALTLKGASKNGIKPEIIGGFKAIVPEGDIIMEGLKVNGNNVISNMIDVDATSIIGNLNLRDCECFGFTSRLISNSGAATISSIDVSGLLVHDFGTSGDFIDVRKGTVDAINVSNSTFYNGIRTFLRVDAAVVCNAVTVKNNTFFNLGAVDSKDNNGILHIRSTTANSDVRQIVVEKNIFASMHRAEETPTQTTSGFPHLISKASATIAVPTVKDNLFWDIDATGDYNWWTYMPEEKVALCGTVLSETPFTGDTAAGKFTVDKAYKGYGDLRW